MVLKSTKKTVAEVKETEKKSNGKKSIKKVELENLEKELLSEKAEIIKELTSLDEVVLNNSAKDTNKDISGVSIHLADIGTDNQEIEKLLTIRERLDVRLMQIENALLSIKKGDYGVCSNCHKAINIERLLAMPYAEYCIDCMEEMEKTGIL